ncbi:hypothetical protein ACK1U3_15885 [Pseudomonas promysalinigenes]|uniref:hypothetical protein n=1 Tax=Pseudomonas promysalinigenes TaxID=485898 RepID=UPI003916D2D5
MSTTKEYKLDIKVDFEELSQGRLVIRYVDGDFSKVHSYKVPLDFFICADSLVALAIACRPKAIELVAFNFPISKEAASVLLRDYKITASSEVSEFNRILGREPLFGKIPHRKRRFLSFSGGVDSLAARFLIGHDAEILSIDYGPRFAREREFFEKWQTLVIETNFREKPFSENIDWRFMSSGALLMSDYLGIETVIFGTILEASPVWFNTVYRPTFEESKHYQSFALAKIAAAQSVASLSEYGTTKVAHCYGREILEYSIKSAADNKTSKKLRKLLLGKIITGEEITEEWAEQNSPAAIPSSGTSFAEDILGLYFAWKLGDKFTNKHILRMDYEYQQFSKTADMSFFEKYNQFNLSATPTDLKQKFVRIFAELEIKPYEERDIDSLQKVRKFLSERFNFKP